MDLSLRLATRIDTIVSHRVTACHILGLPPRLHTCLQSCMSLDSKIRKARSMGLAAAEKVLHTQLRSRVFDLAEKLENNPLKHTHPVKTMGVKDILADIKAVEEEFGGYEWCHKQGSISVITEPITLLNVKLGRFKINLNVSSFKDPYESDGALYVSALDPNYSHDYVHPHVSEGGVVCLGEGVHIIRKALEEGRVLDYFIILKQLLNSYDAEGSYTRLESWGEHDDEDRMSCRDCGYDTSDSYFCDCCEHSYCQDCYGHCETCDEGVCDTCRLVCVSCTCALCPACDSTNCTDCGSSLCESCAGKEICVGCNSILCLPCARACVDCGNPYCKSCSVEEIGDCECGKTGHCSSCREKCDFLPKVHQPGENDLGQTKEQPESDETQFGALTGFLPEPAVRSEEECEDADADAVPGFLPEPAVEEDAENRRHPSDRSDAA